MFLEEMDSLDPYQLRPRPYNRTEMELVTAQDDLLKEADMGNITLLALLDLSAAFDTINHGILLGKLLGLGIGAPFF